MVLSKEERKKIYNSNHYKASRANMTERQIMRSNQAANRRLKKRRKKIRDAKGVKRKVMKEKEKLKRKKHNWVYYRKQQLKTAKGKFNRMQKLLNNTDWDDVWAVYFERYVNMELPLKELETDIQLLEYVSIYQSGNFCFAYAGNISDNETGESNLSLLHLEEVNIGGNKVIIPRDNATADSFGIHGILLFQDGIVYHNNPFWKLHESFMYLGHQKRHHHDKEQHQEALLEHPFDSLKLLSMAMMFEIDGKENFSVGMQKNCQNLFRIQIRIADKC